MYKLIAINLVKIYEKIFKKTMKNCEGIPIDPRKKLWYIIK